jgi:SAM-dependent methyltransferase
MNGDRRARWEERHAAAQGLGEVAAVLREHGDWLPRAGRALDLACGRGANALWLAERGLDVSAWDFSSNAIQRLREDAAARGLHIDARVRDVVAEPPPADGFDLILVSHFLERALCRSIAAALRPGGLLCYQTFGPWVPGAAGPSSPDFRLDSNELLALFKALTICSYREAGELADADDPLRGQALLVARRPV